MYRHWEDSIKPILSYLKPKHIVEIGVDDGFNTKNLIEFCRENDSYLTAIDPVPKEEAIKLIEANNQIINLLQDLSLNALQKITNADLILIDGDHNWYTVFNELKIIEKKHKKFPLILFHDVAWPYAKRDLYYDPSTIPNEFRKPYEKNGMWPEQSRLTPDGLNKNLFNALEEGGSQNGVLTAVEDFLISSERSFEFYKQDSFNGLGILWEEGTFDSKILRQIINFESVIEKLEKSRCTNDLVISQTKQELSQTKQELSQTKQELSQTKQELDLRIKEIQSVYLSKSWKITAPLRITTQIYRNFKIN